MLQLTLIVWTQNVCASLLIDFLFGSNQGKSAVYILLFLSWKLKKMFLGKLGFHFTNKLRILRSVNHKNEFSYA